MSNLEMKKVVCDYLHLNIHKGALMKMLIRIRTSWVFLQ